MGVKLKMNKIDVILEEYSDYNLLIANGFDDAILGVAYNKINGEHVVVYSISKCIDILIYRDGMSYEEAVEYFNFNVEGAHVGEKTPIWVDDDLFSNSYDSE